jgi:protoporphyrinogen oxidase
MKSVLSIFILAVFGSLGAAAQQKCAQVLLPQVTQSPDSSQLKNISSRYGVNPSEIAFTPKLKIPVVIKKSGAETLIPKIPVNTIPVQEPRKYDVVVVGGGPAGLTSALYLAEAGKSVLIIERNAELGGLAAGSDLKGISAGGGAAYSTGPDGGLAYKIFQKIGLGPYRKKLSIPEPIDSYLKNGKLYKEIWDQHTLAELPASFALFKHALLRLCKKGASKYQGPMAEWADQIDMEKMVRMMPALVESWKDYRSKRILARFNSDPKVDKSKPMDDVLELLNLYGRSALGGEAKQISSRQFMDFYESEIFTRFTGTLGTGTVAAAIIAKLKGYPNLVDFRVSSPVASIENTGTGTKVKFMDNNILKEVESQKTIFAAPVSSAPKLIKGLAESDPLKVKTISEVNMADYAVHVVRLKGHPYRATYDTWIANSGDLSKPTDVILGRWQDPKIQAYLGMRNFERNPTDDFGVITIYQPLEGYAKAENFSEENTLARVEVGVTEMINKLQPFARQSGQEIEVELVETYRWPYSINVVSPGYLQKIPILARPNGNIHFANNTVAAPELETAMARGAAEALDIISVLGAGKKAAGF